jgi:probable rRNA maturation factor
VLVALARRLAPRALGVQLVVGDDALLRRLNREFRDSDRGTDVLSFLYEASPRRKGRGGDGPDAEIFVSLPRAAAQARERGHGTAEEMLVLALHGMLHLQGHDHHAPAPARRMGAAEAAHLDWVGRRWPRLRPRPMLEARR